MLCNRTTYFAADNKLAQHSQSSACPCRVSLHEQVQCLSGRCFLPKLPLSLRGSSPPHITLFLGPSHSSPQTASRSIQSQMLCCTVNCQWEKNPKIAHSHWDFVTLPEQDRATTIGNIHKKIGRDQTCCSGDILEDRQT